MQRGWVVSPDYRTLIDTLALLRRELGVSQRELARRIGKPPSFVNKTELFERRLDVLEFIVIAEALGRKPDQLLGTLRTNLSSVIQL
jgi:transcriptional regulator with XRE-family HTH domain